MLALTPAVPRFPGPYAVGSAEYEIPISEIDTQTSPPDPNITTIKFRLFYPTDAPYQGETIPWVPDSPTPQKQWVDAFGRFLGASLGWSSIVNSLLGIMTCITIPAIPNAPLRRRSTPYPLAIFSHGLAGNHNTYSYLCGSLASCGIITAAPEHRDGSCPIAMIRSVDGKVASEVPYRKYSHNPTEEIFNARNAQLRTRLWELDLLYAALNKLNSGEQLANYALVGSKEQAPNLDSSMDFTPGHVTWVGHSFGAATITQFVKSIYYHHSLPSLKGAPHEEDPHWAPIYRPHSSSALITQITPSSPVALLDVWTMPLRAQSTEWLWERPLPSHDRPSTDSGPTAVSVMSTEFYNWTELLNRTRALLSYDPKRVATELSGKARSPQTPKLEDTPKPVATPPNKHSTDPREAADQEANDLLPPAMLPLDADSASRSRSPSPAPSSTSSTPSSRNSQRESRDPSPASSTTSLSPSIPPLQPQTHKRAPAKLFHIERSAHLSQSDFGPLFPTLTRVLMKAADPLGTMELNVRAVTQAMRNAGIRGVRRVDQRDDRQGGWLRGLWGGKARDEDEDEDTVEAEPEPDNIFDRAGPPGGMPSWEKKTAPLKRWVELDIPTS